jgi:hypothetical protein
VGRKSSKNFGETQDREKQIRSPKSEAPNQIPMPKIPTKAGETPLSFGHWVIGISFGDSGIRISGFPNGDSDFGFSSGRFGLRASDFSSGYNPAMPNAQQMLDATFLEMRWRCLSLAADLDRVERSPGGSALLAADPRIAKLRQAMEIILREGPSRAEAVQNIFSDKTEPMK